MSGSTFAMFGLEVPAGDVAIPAKPEIPCSFRITMAAIDPDAEPEGESGAPVRATLKVIRQPLPLLDSDDEDEEDFDVDEMNRILAGDDDEEDEDDSDDEDVNGGPSDPSRSKKAQKEAKLLQKLMETEEEDMELDSAQLTNGVNGLSAKAKGKLPASDEDDEEDDDEDDDEDGEVEEFVICTLDPIKTFQQPLDITFRPDEEVFFKVTGTHSIYLTGNFIDDRSSSMYDDEDEDDDEYDLSPDEDELDMEDDEEEDELDDIDDPRITELIDEDEEAPKLVTATQTLRNKRSAPSDEVAGLDEAMDKSKLSKKQLKKLKKNDGSAAAVAEEAEPASATKSDKKVQFAKELEQGPTPTKATEKAAGKTNNKTADKAADKAADSTAGKAATKANLGVKVVQGVTLDDKKLGTGPAAKSGDRVGMRYIGKLKDGKVFDSNKKGKPFSFKLGAGEVIKGWEIGIQGMSTGGERRITIPAHLAYGSKGVPGIPPNSTLIFDVKLLDLNKGK